MDRYQGRVVRSTPLVSGPASRIIGLAMIHLAAAFFVALRLYGGEVDEPRTASGLDRTLVLVHDILWFPNDAILRALPESWTAQGAPVTVTVMIVSSLLWGLTVYAIWRIASPATRKRRQPRPAGRPKAPDGRGSRV